MVDTRFHPNIGPVPLAALLSATPLATSINDARAGSLVILAAEELSLADGTEIALAASNDYANDLRHTAAGAVVVSPKLLHLVPAGTVAIVAEKAHDVFADILDYMYPDNTRAVIAASASGRQSEQEIESDVVIGPNVVLGSNVEIGRGSVIGANTVIGEGVTIGRNSIVGANCTIECAHLGNNVVIQSGARIGTEGFGWLGLGTVNRKVPQLGRVIIQDKVEVGANSTVDRGALGDTVIGEGTKLDNHVQVGHNCRLGRYCLCAAFTGLSGSTILGDGVIMGGGAATSGHLAIGSKTVVQAWGGVTKSWPAGSHLAGFPAQDIRNWLRELATMRRLNKGDDR